MRLALLAFALLPSIVLATISISAPSTSNYWVQGAANNLIQWTSSGENATLADVIITNKNISILNGDFSIAVNVQISQSPFTVTNVTLLVADGYTLSFVSASNTSQILAQSSTFEVKPPGTSPAPTTTANPTSASGSGNSSGTGTASGASASSTSNKKNEALGSVAVNPGLIYALGLAFGTLLL